LQYSFISGNGAVIFMVEWAVPIGAGIAFFGGAIACGWAQSRIGAAGAGTVAEKPETAGVIIILEALPETLAILGFVVATLIILMSG
jgi:V/A-type H+-transporting ATPase subunit K